MAAICKSNFQRRHTDLTDRALVGDVLQDITMNHTKVYYLSVFIKCVCVRARVRAKTKNISIQTPHSVGMYEHQKMFRTECHLNTANHISKILNMS
jgi:hypothetical protein